MPLPLPVLHRRRGISLRLRQSNEGGYTEPKMRLACAGKAQPIVGRVVFSSSEDLTRAARTMVVAAETRLVSWMTVAAEGLFATLFPSDCRLCGTPLVKISRLPVCQECLFSIRPMQGRICAHCGERLIGPYQMANEHGEAVCGTCR